MSTNLPTAVTIDRVVLIMKEFGIELVLAEDPSGATTVASANLNGYPIVFAALGSVLIVRADRATESLSADANPQWQLACNHVNCFNFSAKAVVVDRGEHIIVRTEKDILIAAGLTSVQLSAMLKNAIDHVLALQEAINSASKELIAEVNPE